MMIKYYYRATMHTMVDNVAGVVQAAVYHIQQQHGPRYLGRNFGIKEILTTHQFTESNAIQGDYNNDIETLNERIML